MSVSDFNGLTAITLQQEAKAYSAETDNGAAVDTLNAYCALIVLNVGVITGAGTVDVKVQECATSGGTYTDITGAAFTQVVAAGDQTAYTGRLMLNGIQRYIRVVYVAATAGSLGATSVILMPKYTGDADAQDFSV